LSGSRRQKASDELATSTTPEMIESMNAPFDWEQRNRRVRSRGVKAGACGVKPE
jgi:hypothetical protein